MPATRARSRLVKEPLLLSILFRLSRNPVGVGLPRSMKDTSQYCRGQKQRSSSEPCAFLIRALLVACHPFLLFFVGSKFASGRPEECSSGRGAYMLESILHVCLQSLFVLAVGVDVF